MTNDFGDDSGEKLVDWMIRIGQDAGEAVSYTHLTLPTKA